MASDANEQNSARNPQVPSEPPEATLSVPAPPPAAAPAGGGRRNLVLLALLACLAVWYFRPRGDSFARHLPEDTLVWIRQTKLDKLAEQPPQRAALENLLELLRHQEPLVQFLAEELDLRVGRDASDEFLAWLGSLEAVDLLFQGVRITGGAPMPELLAVLEFGSAKNARRLAERLERIAEEGDDHDGVTIHELKGTYQRELGVPASPCYALTGRRVLLSLDPRTLEDQLDNLARGPKQSLAKNSAYRRAAKRMKQFDNRTWIGPKLVDELADLAPEEAQKTMRTVLEASGVTAIQGVYAAGSNDGGKGLAGILLDESSGVYRAFALPSERSAAAAWIPAEASLLACARIGDGEKRLDAILDYVGRVGVAAGEMDSPREVQDAVREMREEAGVDLETIAVGSREIGLFMVGELDDDNLVIYLECRNKKVAGEILADILGSAEMREMEKSEVTIKGVPVTVGRWGTALAQFEQYLLVAPEGGEELMERVLSGRDSGKTLAKDTAYAATAGRLPGKAGARAFLRVGELLAQMRRELGPFGALLNAQGLDFESMAGGMVVTMDDGMAEAQILPSGPAPAK